LKVWRPLAIVAVVVLVISAFAPWFTFLGFFSFTMIDLYKLGIGAGQTQAIEKNLGVSLEQYSLQDTLLAMVMMFVLYPTALISAIVSLLPRRTSFLLLLSAILAVATSLSAVYAIESLKGHLLASTPQEWRSLYVLFISAIRVDFGAYLALFAGLVLGTSYYVGWRTSKTEPVPCEDKGPKKETERKTEDYTNETFHFGVFSIAMGHKLPRIVLISGLVALVIGITLVTIPSLVEVWEPRSQRLVQKVTEVSPSGHYYPSLSLPRWQGKECKDIVVNGSIKALEAEFIDFYAFDKLNYERWSAGVVANPLSRANRTKSVSVSLQLAPDQIDGGLFLVVSNRYAKALVEKIFLDRTMTLYSWQNYDWPIILAFMFWPSPKPTDAVISGKAEAVDRQMFSLLIMDDRNYAQYEAGRPYQTFWQGRGRSSYIFSFPFTPKESEDFPKFVVARERPNIKQSIYLSAKASWPVPKAIKVEYDLAVFWLERTYAHVIRSFGIGVGLVTLGLVLVAVSVHAKHVIK